MVEIRIGTTAMTITGENRSDPPSVLITCGRHDSQLSLSQAANPAFRVQSRIWSAKPKPAQTFPYIPIATDGSTVFHDGKLHLARVFLERLNPLERRRLLTLTCREVDLLLPICLDFDSIATPLEVAFPVFQGIKYGKPLSSRWNELVARLALLRKIGIRGPTLSSPFVSAASYKIERALRTKNGLDRFFALAPAAPYQEVFKLREERRERTIVALDFNSMFGSCMQGEFPEPRSLKYRLHDGQESISENLPIGLYRAVLSFPKSEFFSNFHPMKFALLGTSFPFRMAHDQAIEALFTDNELQYYAKHFSCVRIIESITSEKSVTHPLAREAQRLYRERLRAKAAGQKIKEKALKVRLATLHSATSQRRFQTKFFTNPEKLLQYVSETFQVRFPKSMPVKEKLKRLGGFRFIRIKFEQHGIRARILNHAAADALHAFTSRVVANARVKMMHLLAHIAAFENADICYVNADCVHVSVERDRLQLFLQTLSDQLSDDMGGLRVQCIADKGYWFEPGRYWLTRDGEVVQFANKTFNHPGASTKFQRRRRLRTAYRGEVVSFAADKFLSIERAFSYNKRLMPAGIDDQDYCRYTFPEVSNLEVAGDSIEREVLRSKDDKIQLFERIATG